MLSAKAGRRPGPGGGGTYAVRVKGLGGREIELRPGTSDPSTIVQDVIRGEHRPPENRLIRRAAELGTHIGVGVAALAVDHPEAEILGVEPDLGNFELASRNLEQFGDRCRLLRAAVWDEPGVALTLSGTNPSGYEMTPGKPGSDEPAAEAAEVLTLEQAITTAFGDEWVDYVILNLEGAEVRVLQASGPALQRVGMLRAELHPGKGVTAEAVTSALTAHGFRSWAEEEWWGGWAFGVRDAG